MARGNNGFGLRTAAPFSVSGCLYTARIEAA